MNSAILVKKLVALINSVCEECGNGTEQVARFVRKHDKEQTFIEVVNNLDFKQKWKLLNELWGSNYNIFKPWFYKALMDVINVTYNHKSDFYNIEWEIYDNAVELYEFYKEAFDASKEVEQLPSQEQLAFQHTWIRNAVTNTIIDLIDDGAVDPTTLEILPEYKEQVLNRLSKRSD